MQVWENNYSGMVGTGRRLEWAQKVSMFFNAILKFPTTT